jgi:hypothetical protein
MVLLRVALLAIHRTTIALKWGVVMLVVLLDSFGFRLLQEVTFAATRQLMSILLLVQEEALYVMARLLVASIIKV